MAAYLLDTNILIFLLKDMHGIRRRIEALAMDQIAMSSISLAELHYGAAKSAKRAKSLESIRFLESFFAVKGFDANAAEEYGQIRVDLERKGTPIGPLDMLIAAQARAAGLVLVTNNRREFERVERLQVEDWTV